MSQEFMKKLIIMEANKVFMMSPTTNLKTKKKKERETSVL